MPRGHEVPPWVFPPITPPPRAVPEQWLGWCLGGSLAPRDGQWLAALGGECVGLGGGGPRVGLACAVSARGPQASSPTEPIPPERRQGHHRTEPEEITET